MHPGTRKLSQIYVQLQKADRSATAEHELERRKEMWRTVQIRGVAGDLRGLGLLADDELAVPVVGAHDVCLECLAVEVFGLRARGGSGMRGSDG